MKGIFEVCHEREKIIEFVRLSMTTEIMPQEQYSMPRRTWDSREIRELARRYPEEGLSPLTGLLQRSPDSISSMAKRLGLRSRNRYQHLVRSRALRKIEASSS
jgi:hypothetical protein